MTDPNDGEDDDENFAGTGLSDVGFGIVFIVVAVWAISVLLQGMP
jgi:hypothetical protein